jgi:hypothetical protein
MKPVEDVFSSDTFRRVIMPGVILTIGIHPLAATWISRLDALYGVGPTTLLVAEIIFLGLLVGSAIQGIYYIYEGIILAPLTAFARWANERRVKRLTVFTEGLRSKENLNDSELRALRIAFEKLIDFPVRFNSPWCM